MFYLRHFFAHSNASFSLLYWRALGPLGHSFVPVLRGTYPRKPQNNTKNVYGCFIKNALRILKRGKLKEKSGAVGTGDRGSEACSLCYADWGGKPQ